MSNSSKYSTVDQEPNGARPPAVIHKRILSAAAEHGEETPTQIASRVSGASIQLVEQVLDEYGDADPDFHATKARNASEGSPSILDGLGADDPTAEVDPPSRTELTTKQRRTLYRIHEQPNATQSDLARMFDVDRTSISHRLNNVDGFEWEYRHEFVEQLFDGETDTDDETDRKPDDTRTDSSKTVEETEPSATEPTASADESLPSNESSPSNESPTDANPKSGATQGTEGVTMVVDSVLANKVLHACLESQHITTSEELELMEGLISESDGPAVE